MIGTMIDLIIRRNVVEIGRSEVAYSGWPISRAMTPSATPRTIPMKIHHVSEIRRRKFHIGRSTITAPERNWLALDEGAPPQLVVRVLQLFLRIHHDRPLPRHGLLQRLP